MNSAETGETRAGYVALVGRPNVGKSTLMNALVGEKLSIVTALPQTTRERVTGILTRADTQVVFLDTPGLLEPRYLLQQSMQDAALRALHDADVVLLLLDATRADDTLPADEPLAALHARRARLVVAVNKVDAAPEQAVRGLEAWSSEVLGTSARRISALAGEGTEALLDALCARLPPSPFLYPEDELAVQPVRFFVAELVRETIFEEYTQEIPYSTVVRVEEFREAEDPVYIRATVYVERESQRGIIIGEKGAAIRRLGQRSRAKIEAFVGQRVYLDLWVKAMPRWRKKAGSLRHLGYAAPEGG
ncbi:MAG TPA: GTPase Era [Longimicrobiales bacterium]|nr:GTPase Era [Longimicrobiales bacterium]